MARTVFRHGAPFAVAVSHAGVSGVAEANAAFSPAFDAAYTAHLQKKLGLRGMDLGSGWVNPRRSGGAPPGEMQEKLPRDAQFVLSFFNLMASCRTDFTETWRALLDVPALSERLGATGFEDGICSDDEETLRPLSAVLNAAGASSTARKQWATWIREYSSRIDSQGIGNGHPEGEDEGRKERLEIMRSSSPAFVLRKKSLEQALKAAETGGEHPNKARRCWLPNAASSLAIRAWSGFDND